MNFNNLLDFSSQKQLSKVTGFVAFALLTQSKCLKNMHKPQNI